MLPTGLPARCCRTLTAILCSLAISATAGAAAWSALPDAVATLQRDPANPAAAEVVAAAESSILAEAQAGHLAATAALMDTKVPKVEGAKIVRGEYVGPLPLTSLPLSTTMVKVDDYWLVDPTRDEEVVRQCVLTIGTTENHVCSMQKGEGSLSKEELLGNMDVAFKSGNSLRDILKR